MPGLTLLFSEVCHFINAVTYFTAEAPRTQRVEVLFYPAVRGGRIKGNLCPWQISAQSLCLEETEAFALAASHRQSKKTSPLRPSRLCGEQSISLTYF